MTKRYSKFLSALLLSSSVLVGQAEVKSPKNIIFLIGDGMSFNTITAANYYLQGKDSIAAYQHFPIRYAMSTYNGTAMQEYRADSAWLDPQWVMKRFTDSAPAATAFSTGKKSFDGAIGVDMDKQNLIHFMEYAQDLGKAAGVVTSVEFSHATPAAHVAHNADRNQYESIAQEMLKSNLNVIIGAGHPDYDSDGKLRDNKDYQYVGGEQTWNKLKEGKLGWTFTDDSTVVADYAKGNNVPERLVVVPRVAETLQQGRSGANQRETPYSIPFVKGVNRLPELTQAALNVLNKDKEGFVVMIEGGAIDWANHANQKARMIEEQIDFNNTVDAVIKWVEQNGGWEQNLVVVTSDHECGYLLGEKEGDNKPTTNPIKNKGKGQLPGMKYNSGNHTNMLVPVYAKGAGSEVFQLFADRVDPLRGHFIDNTDIAKSFFLLWNEIKEQKQIKNLIYMVADGWGENQIKATNYYMGENQAYESFPVKLFMSTFHGMGTMGSKEIGDYFTSYNSYKAWHDPEYIKIKPTDSAPAATAMGTGEKTYDGSINMSVELQKMKTLAEVAKEKGKAAGVISSVEFSHATPAAFGSAHNLSRNNYAEIANEMLSSKLDLIMGAGHPEYDDNGQPRTDKEYKYVGGETTWNALKNGTLNKRTFTDEKSRIEEIAEGKNVPDNLVFVAKAATTLQQARSGEVQEVNMEDFNQVVPTLAEMSKASLNILGKDKDGFFIMIEGGAVDWANHANEKGRLIEEQNDFNKSVDAVIDWVEKNSNWDETLLVVTGDHETGYLGGEEKQDLGVSTIKDNGKGKMPSMKFYSGDHTNQLIPFFAKGANAEVLNRIASSHDEKRGYYVDNTDVAILTKLMWSQLADDDSAVGNESIRPFYENDDLKATVSGGSVRLMAPNLSGKVQLRILDISGRLVYNQEVQLSDNGTATVPVQVKAGIAFVVVSQYNQTLTAKCLVR